MGLFDAFSRKQEDSRKALLDMLVKQCNDQYAVNARGKAEVAARRASALDWLATHGDEIANGYERLLAAFLSADADAVATTVRGLGDIAGPVLDIPVYRADGQNQISFRSLAGQLFVDNPNVAFQIKRVPAGLPESAYTRRQVADFMPALNPYKADVGDSTLGTRLSGAHKQAQADQIALLNSALAKMTQDGPVQVAAAQQEVTQAVANSFGALAQKIALQQSFRQAIATGYAEGTLNSIAGLKVSKLLDETLAKGTGDATHGSFTALALHAYETAADRAVVYERFLELGQDPAALTVLAQALDDADALPVATVEKMLKTVEKANGIGAVQALIRDTQFDGEPLLVQAAKNQKLSDALLAPFAEDMVRAVLLQKTAAQTRNEVVAAALHAHAYNLWIADHQGDKVVLKAVTAGGTLQWNVPEDDVDAIMDEVAKREGWFACGGELVNAAHVDNVWPEKLEDGRIKLSLRGRDQSYYAVAPAAEAQKVIRDLAAQQERFVQVGNEIFDLTRAGNIWVTDNDDKDKPARVKFSYGQSTYHVDVTHKDAMQKLSRYAGFCVVGPAELVNAGATDSAILQIDEDGKAVKLRYAVGGRDHSTVFAKPEDAAQAFDLIAKRPGYVALSPLVSLNTAHLSALQTYDAEKLSYNISGKTWTSPASPDKTAGIVSALEKTGDYTALTNLSAVRTDAIALAYYSEKTKRFVVSAGGATTETEMDTARAEILLRTLCGENNDEGGENAGLIFAPEIATGENKPPKAEGLAGAFNKVSRPVALDAIASKTVKKDVPAPDAAPDVVADTPDPETAAPAGSSPSKKPKAPPSAPWDKILK